MPRFYSDHTKNILVECVSSHIRQKNAASMYGARLESSSERILLQSVPGLWFDQCFVCCSSLLKV